MSAKTKVCTWSKGYKLTPELEVEGTVRVTNKMWLLEKPAMRDA